MACTFTCIHCRILVNHLPQFKKEAKSVIWHIEHDRQEEMAKKSEVVSLQLYMYMYSTILALNETNP